jgi:hypothetical protein
VEKGPRFAPLVVAAGEGVARAAVIPQKDAKDRADPLNRATLRKIGPTTLRRVLPASPGRRYLLDRVRIRRRPVKARRAVAEEAGDAVVRAADAVRVRIRRTRKTARKR